MVDKIMSKILKGGQVGCVVGNRTLPGRGGCSAARGLVNVCLHMSESLIEVSVNYMQSSVE